MKKSVKIAIHGCFWILIPLTFALYSWAGQADSFFGFANNSKGFIQILFENFQSLFVRPDMGRDVMSLPNLFGILFNVFYHTIYPVAIFYLFYGYFSPKVLTNKSLGKYLAPVLFMLIVPYAVIKLLSYIVFTVGWSYIYFLSLAYVITFFFAIAGFFFCLLENWLVTERLAKQNLQSELALLKNQVSPHFLFNTLNNIDSLITSNAEKASETLVKLSEILRYMIYDTNVPRVLLADEIGHIQSYMDLQKIQFANRELASLAVLGNPGNMQVAPMLFIPFVENAFKHCTEKNIPGAIRFSFTIQDNGVKFESVNLAGKTQRINKDGASGIGLGNIRRRLELIYPGRHVLNITEDSNTFNVTLSVDTHEH
ncbi:MAG: histidine kinase [Bacteroidetes bacterium]|nr:histidine kinase [Bacteroidota bacterium]